MNQVLPPEIKEVLDAMHYRPAVSVIVPFEPKMSLKTELAHTLKLATDKVELELQENYPAEVSQLVIQKLKTIIKNLNYNTYKKSIAIYVSPVFEKVLYLEMAVKQKIVVDESFEIRDLIYCKKQINKYLVVMLSGKESRIYVVNTNTFVRIVSNAPEPLEAYVNDSAERVANFSDMSKHKEFLMEKYLHHVDNSLDLILHDYQLPLFVMGSERILGHFNSITKHRAAIIDYVQGNYEEVSLNELKNVLEPHIADWKKVLQKDLLNQLEEAAGKKKLVFGIKEVWKEALNHKGKLLVVEKDYRYTAQHGSSADIIYEAIEQNNKFSYIKDAVDDIIEKVLEDGGDVEFVEEGLLKDYQQIALVLYY